MSGSTLPHQKMSAKKKVGAIVAIVLIIALTMGGVLAWNQGQPLSSEPIQLLEEQKALGALLHDDFEPGENKDVYVENIGAAPLMVRVRFQEFLQIDNDIWVGSDPNNEERWETHLFDQEEGGDFQKCALKTHEYYAWEMSGNSKFYLPGTSQPGDALKETLASSAIMTKSQWEKLDKTEQEGRDACWVLNADGWAYWSKPLEPNTATNLLLDNVTPTAKVPEDNYYYAITVVMDVSVPEEPPYLVDKPTIELDGESWVILAEQGGYYLILKCEVLPNTNARFSTEQERNVYEDSTVKEQIDAWFNSKTLDTEVRKYAVGSNALDRLGGFDSKSSPHIDGESAFAISSSGFSAPDESVDAYAFLLSTQETSHFCSKGYSAGTDRIVSHDTNSAPYKNWGRLQDGANYDWWLRSPRVERHIEDLRYLVDTAFRTFVSRSGNSDSANWDDDGYARPALWVKAEFVDEKLKP